MCVGPPKEDTTAEQAGAFCGYARELHAAHLRIASETSNDESSAEARLEAQVRFCEKQLLNDKTRRVLERSMGEELTDRYMREVLFDVTPDTPLRPKEGE